jgi:hypothetical protein
MTALQHLVHRLAVDAEFRQQLRDGKLGLLGTALTTEEREALEAICRLSLPVLLSSIIMKGALQSPPLIGTWDP